MVKNDAFSLQSTMGSTMIPGYEYFSGSVGWSRVIRVIGVVGSQKLGQIPSTTKCFQHLDS